MLAGFAVVVSLMLMVGSFAAWRLRSDNQHLARLASVVVPSTRAVGDINALMNKYRKDQLHYIVARPSDRPLSAPGSIDGDLAGDLTLMTTYLQTYQTRGLVEDVLDQRLLDRFREAFTRYVSITAAFRQLADRGQLLRAGEVVGDGAGDAQWNRLKVIITNWNDHQIEVAKAQANASSSSYRVSLVLILSTLIAACAAAAGVAVVMARRTTRSVREVGAAAKAIAVGEIDQRVTVRSRDELGQMAEDFDAMVTYLRNTVAVAEAISQGDLDVEVKPLSDRDVLGNALALMTSSLSAQARRDTFSTQLVEAMETADDEPAAFHVVERAMVEVDPTAPMELLLSDSSRAHLERAVTSPTGGAAGCPVESPFSCVAVRRGNPAVFETSEALNACPMLRGRPGGTCSAVCVPISFMGRALGVLHTIGPEGAPPNSRQIAQLTALATQAGTRIGTVRAFERTQLQAETDQLTGLNNRRTIERSARELIKQRTPFAFALGDLDHFKLLNDKHGHEAGDHALQRFSHTALESVRDADIVGRWGGEEFVIIFPGLDQLDARSVIERLHQTLSAYNGPHARFTVSFGVTDSSHADTIQGLLQIADAALYAAKENGRNQTQLGTTLADALAGHTHTSTTDPQPAETPNTEPPAIRLNPIRLHHALADDESPDLSHAR